MLLVLGHAHVLWLATEASLNVLDWVEVPVEVTSCSKGRRKHGSRGVDGLPDIAQVDFPGDLFDHQWSDFLAPQPFVSA